MYDQVCLANKQSCLGYREGRYCVSIENCVHKATKHISIGEHTNRYFKGASDFMKFMHDYYDGKEPIYPSEMEYILAEFIAQHEK